MSDKPQLCDACIDEHPYENCPPSSMDCQKMRTLERDNAALRADAEKWRGLALLDPMDIATVICGAPTAKKMLDDLSRRIDAAKEKA